MAALLSVSCVRFEVFTCSADTECVLDGVQGFCETSGYCSFPDTDCRSGTRYSDHAPGGLAGECTDDAETSSSSSSGSSSSSSEDESSSSGAVPTCGDGDGDGFGLGETCEGPDCDDDNARAIDDCVYLGPGGNDANAGTRDSPWLTFDHALANLEPGSSLVVLDGEYTHGDAGTLHAVCAGEMVSGTAAAPIFVRAENDRQAVIDADGIGAGISLYDCDHWRVRGFSVVTRDRSAEQGADPSDTVGIALGNDVVLRQLYVSGVNRYYNVKGLSIVQSEDVLVEDVEVHDFFRSGFIVYVSDRVTCRRCYGHSHEAADLPACPDLPACLDPMDPVLVGTAACPFCSAGSSERGDETFLVQYSNDFLCENCVSEGSYRGYHLLGGEGMDGTRGGSGYRVLQSLSVGDDFAAEIRNAGDVPPPMGAVLEDFVAIAPGVEGIRVVSPDGLVIRNASVLGAQSGGVVVVSSDETLCTGGACSIEIEAALVLDAGESGIEIGTVDAWSIVRSNVFGSASDYVYPDMAGDPWDDDEGAARDNQSVDAMGVGLANDECRVYVPEDSNVQGIGGSVTDLLIDGVSSGEPLWSEDGSFPCGPAPMAPPSIAGEQCIDLADRVHVGTTECPSPPARD
jgi:hypothetical protein